MTNQEREFNFYIEEEWPGFYHDPPSSKSDTDRYAKYITIKEAFEAGWQAGGGGDR